MARPIDRRVQKTKGLLHGALASLIHEKPYDGVVVKEILARANVGRSTFYAHYRDKDELLDAGLRDMLRKCAAKGECAAATPGQRVLRFSLPLFEHIGSFREAAGKTIDGARQAVVHERLREALTKWLLHELKRMPRRRGTAERVPIELLAGHVASTFVLVLSRWLESESESGPRVANSRFLALSLSTLASVLEE